MIRLLLPLSILLVSAPLTAQGGVREDYFRWEGTAPGVWLGSEVWALPDLDGDGDPENAVWGDFTSTAGYSGIQIRSSSGSAPRYVLPATLNADLAATDDVDGDGVLDLFVSEDYGGWSHGTCSLYSGATGSLLYTITASSAADRFGSAILVLPDRDGDGVREVAVAAPTSGLQGVVRVYSGATGTHLQDVSPASGDSFGSRLFTTGDLDGDGLLDWAARLEDGAELVRTFSSASLQPLFDVQPAVPEGSFAHSGGRIGDLDGDGIDDLAFGVENCQHWGHAIVFSGADGSELRNWDGLSLHVWAIGRELAAAGDLDRDGSPELALVSQKTGSSNPPQLVLLSLTDGRLMQRFLLDAIQSWTPIVVIDSVERDGEHAILLGSGLVSVNGFASAGVVESWTWYEGLHATGTDLASSSGGFLGFRVDLPPSAAGDDFQLLFSAAGTGPMMLGEVEVPLTVDALLAQCSFGRYPAVVRSATGTLDADGDGTAWVFAYPNQLDPALVGRTIHAAAVCAPPGGTWRYSSVALPIEITP